MIDPRRYNTWPRELERLAQELEDYILRDIARRLKKAGSITATAENQIARLIEQGKSAEAIQKEISRVSGIHQKKIEGLYEKAARESQRFDAEVFRKLGKEAPALRNNQYLQTVIRAQSRQTQGEFVNMTQSLGFMLVERGRLVFTPLATAYQRALDLAVEKVLSGAVSQDRAVKDAVKALADSGVRTADYAGGHTDQLDVAVQRAVRTGMNQISARVTDANLDEQQSPLVEVSAHAGARDKGDDFKNHKLWQGKVYYWRQRDRWNRGDLADKYPDFVDSTGYGDVAGLEGANCRHSYRVFIEGVSKRMYTDEELANIDGPPVQYKGKTYTAYERCV